VRVLILAASLHLVGCPAPQKTDDEVLENLSEIEAKVDALNDNVCRLLSRFRVTPKNGSCADSSDVSSLRDAP
jgi:outer membrane murein-binding lipoprotein Lpp